MCIILSSIESLPHPPFMDHHSSCFIGTFGETTEDVHAPEGEITTPTRFPRTEIPGSTIFTLSITGKISKLDSIYTSYKPLIHTMTQLL